MKNTMINLGATVMFGGIYQKQKVEMMGFFFLGQKVTIQVIHTFLKQRTGEHGSSKELRSFCQLKNTHVSY